MEVRDDLDACTKSHTMHVHYLYLPRLLDHLKLGIANVQLLKYPLVLYFSNPYIRKPTEPISTIIMITSDSIYKTICSRQTKECTLSKRITLVHKTVHSHNCSHKPRRNQNPFSKCESCKMYKECQELLDAIMLLNHMAHL